MTSPIRGSSRRTTVPAQAKSQVSQSKQKAESQPTPQGYSSDSAFEDVKKSVNDFSYDGFSTTRLEDIKKDTLDSMKKWLDAHPDASEADIQTELQTQYDKMVGKTLLEKMTFDDLWNQLQSMLQKSQDEMKKALGGNA